MDYDDFAGFNDVRDTTYKDWLKASNASLAKLQEVGTKIYNLDIADSRRLKVNKNNLQVKTGSNSSLLADGTPRKCAWGSQTSIPELLRRQNERQKQSRPVSAKVSARSAPTKTRTRPQSAKELGAAPKPPTGLGVKGVHRGLEERPPGGIGVGAGAGWAAPPAGVLGMSGREIDDVLSRVSASQHPSGGQTDSPPGGAPPPPRGSPDFTEMLNTGAGSEYGVMIEDLLFDKNMLPSEILSRPPPEPIHVTMPRATLDPDRGDTPDLDDGHRTPEPGMSNQHNSSTYNSQRPPRLKTRLDVNMNTAYDDTAPWQSCDETDDEEILVEASPGRGRHRTVTFNEEKNETTLITPRGSKKVSRGNKKDTLTNDSHSNGMYDVLEDQLPKATQYDPHGNQLPRPKQYAGRADLRWVKSRTDSGGVVVQDDGGRGGGRRGSGRGGRGEEGRGQCVPTVSVAFFDDLAPESETQTTPKPGEKKAKKGADKKGRRCPGREEVETVISTVGLSDDDDDEGDDGGQGTDRTEWATPGSLTTKVVSGAQKNYYELALQARMAKHRSLQQQQQPAKEDSSIKTKTIKTFEFGDGEVIEHKTVSTVDAHSHPKKEYVLPKEARPHSALRVKTPQDPPVTGKTPQDPLLTGNTPEDPPAISEGQGEKTDHPRSVQGVTADREAAQRRNVNLSLGVEYDTRLKPDPSPRPASGRPNSGRPNSGRPNSGRPTSARPTSARPSSGRPSSSRPSSSRQTHSTKPAPSGDDRSADRPSSRLAFNDPPEEGSLQEGLAQEGPDPNHLNVPSEHYGQHARQKKPRAVSAPVRRGPTLEKGQLSVGGAGLSASPYGAPVHRPRPYSASVVTDKKRAESAQGKNIKISTKISFKEYQRVKSAAKLVKRGKLGHPKVYKDDKYYANYQRPPPKPVHPYLRRKMAEPTPSAGAEKEAKEPSLVQIWTRQDDFEVETEGINECKKIQDKLLEQGVPVTLDTLTRALLPPGECALRGATYVTSTNPTLPEDTSRLLSKPAIWFPEEFNRLQRARKLAQRAEQSLKEQEWEERSRYMTSQMSVGSAKKTKKKKKKKKKQEEMSRSSSGIL